MFLLRVLLMLPTLQHGIYADATQCLLVHMLEHHL
jgi:hypothetical protein